MVGRSLRRPGAQHLSERAAGARGRTGFFESSDPRVIKLRAGTDFPQDSQSDRDFVNALHDMGRSHRDDDVLERYFAFTERAADPQVEIDRANGRGSFFYPVGRLFGHTDRSRQRRWAFDFARTAWNSESGRHCGQRIEFARSLPMVWKSSTS